MSVSFQTVSNKTISDKKYNGQISDLSYNGMLFITDKALNTLDEIKLSLMSSIMSDDSNDIYARVVNCVEENKKYIVSVEFTSIEQQAQDTLRFYVDSIIQNAK